MTLNPEVFLKAAESLAADITPYCACMYVWKHSGTFSAEDKFFDDVFNPRPGVCHVYFGKYDEENRGVRETALLFAYEIAKDMKKQRSER